MSNRWPKFVAWGYPHAFSEKVTKKEQYLEIAPS